MDTSLSRECAAAAGLGHTPRGMFEHALAGAFCDDDTKARLRQSSETFDWEGAAIGGRRLRAE